MDMILLKYILSSIKKSNSISDVAKKGYTFSQIGSALVDAVSENYLTIEDDKYVLTDKGKKSLLEQKPYELFSILNEYKLDKPMTLEQIYIPKYNKGDFER